MVASLQDLAEQPITTVAVAIAVAASTATVVVAFTATPVAAIA